MKRQTEPLTTRPSVRITVPHIKLTLEELSYLRSEITSAVRRAGCL